jgi:hypothetical protein
MKTVAVTLGGKEYSAAQLTVPEQCEFARITPELEAAGRERDCSKAAALLTELLKIICASILRAGLRVTPGEANEWPIGDLLKARQTLADFIGELPTRANLDPRANLN